MSTPDIPHFQHGTVRGSEDPRRSRSFEGRFGRMFRNLPPAVFPQQEGSPKKGKTGAPQTPRFEEQLLDDLGGQMIPDASEEATAGSEEAPVAAKKARSDFGKESTIPAGYTYLGQFIAHDLTFDPASSLQRDNDPDALVNFRTPRFDLDCIYGRGPDDQPYLYQTDSVRMLLGDELTFQPVRDGEKSETSTLPKLVGHDLPRAGAGPALIGDPRNNENLIIAQLHSIFLSFHNRMADKLKKLNGVEPTLAEVQRLVRWHYQWVVIHDFLERIINKETYDTILPHLPHRNGIEDERTMDQKKKSDFLEKPAALRFYKPKREAFIPVEFSAAAYRFGHSMVRAEYNVNQDFHEGIGGPLRIMSLDKDNPGLNLPAVPNIWLIDWSLFFERLGPDTEWDTHNFSAKDPSLRRGVQRAMRIDPILSSPLATLPFAFKENVPSLASRNLIRGQRLGLPSGQAVAAAMGEEPLSDKKLFPDGLPAAAFKGNAPLWYYVLAEASQVHNGNQLGPVGGRIVMETFVGLLLEDGHSFLRQYPLWTPCKAFPKDPRPPFKFGMAEFIREAQAPPAPPET